MAEVTVVVVSWNTCELLLRCLDSLAEAVNTGTAEVWVIDNGSTDGSAAAARRHAPWARVLAVEDNLGFGRAVNLAAGRSHSDWLLAANADISLEPHALGRMLDAGADPKVGCVAPRLLREDGSTEHSVHPFPTLPLTLAFNLGLQSISGRLGERLCLEGFWDPQRPRPVPWAIGACLLLRRSAFAAAGGFDEAQWMYAEDLDLGWRLRRAGWITRYEPSARVCHSSGAAARQAFGEDRAARFMLATYALLLRRRGAPRTLATIAVNVAGAAARLAAAAPLAPWWPGRRAARDHYRRWLRAHLAAARALAREDRRA